MAAAGTPSSVFMAAALLNVSFSNCQSQQRQRDREAGIRFCPLQAKVTLTGPGWSPWPGEEQVSRGTISVATQGVARGRREPTADDIPISSQNKLGTRPKPPFGSCLLTCIMILRDIVFAL